MDNVQPSKTKQISTAKMFIKDVGKVSDALKDMVRVVKKLFKKYVQVTHTDKGVKIKFTFSASFTLPKKTTKEEEELYERIVPQMSGSGELSRHQHRVKYMKSGEQKRKTI